MAQRLDNREKLAFKLNSLSDNEINEVLDYISIMESMHTAQRRPEVFEDDIIALLAEARENKRAQVVHEWDRIRRRADQRTVFGLRASH